MRSRTALVLALVTAAFIAGTYWLSSPHPTEGGLPSLIIGAWLLLLSVVGLLIARRQPTNPVGWLLQAVPLITAAATFLNYYAWYGLTYRSGSLPGALAAGWINRWIGTTAFGLFALIVLLFPTGNYPSSRWRWVGRATVVASLVEALVFALLPGRLDAAPRYQNPIGLSEISGLLDVTRQIAEFVLVFCAFAAIASLVLRFRRSHGVERQQIKWVAFAVAAFPVAFAGATAVEGLWPEKDLDFFFIFGGLLLFPISIGVAMLRFKLYEIDIIVNRTIVYLFLTAIIVAAYLGLVTALQSGLRSFIEEGSDLAVAASTLAVAGLFHPLRGRIQEFVDHRFYRRKYDATRVLAGFSQRMRQEIDLEMLSRELVEAVHETMHPRHVSLWLREPHASEKAPV